MKNILKSFLIVYLIIPMSVFAQTYTISDYDIEINFSDEWDIFTKDNLKENKNYEKYNITYNYMKNFMETNFIYLDAIYHSEKELFIRISPEPSTVNNLSNFNDSDLDEFARELLKKTGATNYNFLKSNNITYIKSSYYDSKAQTYILEYITVVNGNNITFTFQSYDDFLNQSLEGKIEQVIKSTVIKIDSNKAKENISSGFNWGVVFEDTIIGAIIGAVIGGIGGIFLYIKQKRNDKTQV